MADQTEGTIHIRADRSAIMAQIADFEAYPEWSGDIKVAEVRERDDDGRATHVYYEVAAGPINASHVLSYVYKPDDGGVEWSFVEGAPLRNFAGEYVLEPDGDGTLVTYRATIDAPIPMPGFMKRRAEKVIVDTALKGLKARVEG